MGAPPNISRALLADELPAAEALAKRMGWEITFNKDLLRVDVQVKHPKTGHLLLLDADLAGYRAVPPAWQFLEPKTREAVKNAWPAAAPVQGKSSIFHGALICAPFNRLAFKDLQGPHNDWGGPTAWLDVKGTVFAANLAEMLQVIRLHLSVSPGMMT
jgi:hypothetical protein